MIAGATAALQTVPVLLDLQTAVLLRKEVDTSAGLLTAGVLLRLPACYGRAVARTRGTAAIDLPVVVPARKAEGTFAVQIPAVLEAVVLVRIDKTAALATGAGVLPAAALARKEVDTTEVLVPVAFGAVDRVPADKAVAPETASAGSAVPVVVAAKKAVEEVDTSAVPLPANVGADVLVIGSKTVVLERGQVAAVPTADATGWKNEDTSSVLTGEDIEAVVLVTVGRVAEVDIASGVDAILVAAVGRKEAGMGIVNRNVFAVGSNLHGLAELGEGMGSHVERVWFAAEVGETAVAEVVETAVAAAAAVGSKYIVVDMCSADPGRRMWVVVEDSLCLEVVDCCWEVVPVVVGTGMRRLVGVAGAWKR